MSRIDTNRPEADTTPESRVTGSATAYPGGNTGGQANDRPFARLWIALITRNADKDPRVTAAKRQLATLQDQQKQQSEQAADQAYKSAMEAPQKAYDDLVANRKKADEAATRSARNEAKGSAYQQYAGASDDDAARKQREALVAEVRAAEQAKRERDAAAKAGTKGAIKDLAGVDPKDLPAILQARREQAVAQDKAAKQRVEDAREALATFDSANAETKAVAQGLGKDAATKTNKKLLDERRDARKALSEGKPVLAQAKADAKQAAENAREDKSNSFTVRIVAAENAIQTAQETVRGELQAERKAAWEGAGQAVADGYRAAKTAGNNHIVQPVVLKWKQLSKLARQTGNAVNNAWKAAKQGASEGWKQETQVDPQIAEIKGKLEAARAARNPQQPQPPRQGPTA